MWTKQVSVGIVACGLLLGALNGQVPRLQDEQLVDALVRERDLAKKQVFLEQWFAQNPQEGTGPLIDAAKRRLMNAPDDFGAQYTLVGMIPWAAEPSPQTMLNAVMAAEALLGGGIETQFAASSRPQSVSENEWHQDRVRAFATVHRTLGWIAMKRQDHVTAEKHLVKSLELYPNASLASYWLATEVMAQSDAAKNELALFSIARAVVYEGKGALPPEDRVKLEEYLLAVYTKYTGSVDGLDELKRLAKNQPFPPPDLKIESAEVRRYNRDRASCAASFHVGQVTSSGELQQHWVTGNMNKWLEKHLQEKFPELCLTAHAAQADYVILWAEDTATINYTYTVPKRETSIVSLDTTGHSWGAGGYRSGNANTFGTVTTTRNETQTGTRNEWHVTLAIYETNRGRTTKVYQDNHVGRYVWSKPDKDGLVDALKFVQERARLRR